MQVFNGWGVSLAWWANVVGQYPEGVRQDYMEKAFDPIKGLGLNIVRYNIGGGENPKYDYLRYRTAVPGYEPSFGVWDWGADPGQRWVLTAARARGVNCMEVFANSPPYWMTLSGSVTGGANGGENLDMTHVDDYVNYLVEVIDHFRREWGITFQTIDPFNEPDAYWWKIGDWQEGCAISVKDQQTVIKRLTAALKLRGLSTQVSAPDTNSIDSAVSMFSTYDDETKRSVRQINTHSYNGTDRTELANLANVYGKRLWMSEYGDSDQTGLTMSRTILNDLKRMRVSAWIAWQLADPWQGWGLIRDPLEKVPAEHAMNPKYYVMGNYSRYIRPGYRIINIDDDYSVAAWDRGSHTLVIVTTNDTDVDHRVEFDLGRFSRCGGSVAEFRTSATEQLSPLTPVSIVDKRFTAACPAKSVTTFVVRDAEYSGRSSFEPTAYYRLVNCATGLELSVDGGTTRKPGANTVLAEPAHGSIVDQPTAWAILPSGGKGFFVVNRSTGLTLDVNHGSVSPGAAVIVWTETDGLNQHWLLQSASKGKYRIISQSSGLALSTSGSGSRQFVTQESAASADAYQQWKILKVRM